MSHRGTVSYKAARVAALAAIAAGLHLPAQAQDAPAAAGFQATEVIDHAGFGEPLPAGVLEIPKGWRTQGGVNWNRGTNCVNNQMRIEWQTASPDGLQALELMHGFNWQLQGTQISMNPCPVLPFNSTQAFLQAVVQQRRQGARVLEYRSRPEVAEAAAKTAPPLPAQMKRHIDAGQLFIEWRTGGQAFHEVLSATVTFSQVGGNVMGGTGVVVAQRAPAGRLDTGLGERIAGSFRPNPHWTALMRDSTMSAEKRFSDNQRRQIAAWHAAEMARINAQGAADRAAIRAETNREVARINSQTYANTQATNDRMHRRNLEAIGEYDTYRDSSGNQVRSSIHGGDRVLRLPNGNYTSTRDPYYNPPGSEELQRVR